jgi:hypothetical protein
MAQKRTRAARKHRRQHGAAMVEGTVMVPVFIVLWLAVVYLQQLYGARGLARMEARRCAFEHAMTGCDDPPKGCTGLNVQTEAVDKAKDITSVASTGTDPDLDPFEDIPVIGTAFHALFGTTTASTIEKRVPFPFDAEHVGIAKGQVVLLCNSKPQTVFEIAKERVCDALDIDC